MIPDWMKEAYFAKSGDDHLVGDNVICNEHGFLTYDIKGDVFEMCNVFGNGNHWQPEMERIAREAGCKTILCATLRNPKPMCRKFGYSVAKVITVLQKEI